jgi:hypothetical protein
MSPEVHCSRVIPERRLGPVTSHELARFCRATAVPMNSLSAFRTARFFSGVNGTCFGSSYAVSSTTGPLASPFEPGLEK